ncbi:hypothetical protein DFS34DRAFT_226425 [Phlyctochytrium arcticum]|nr:hypothetical protein DFS34DRAFT_226425 [Phlyctochytrium arcticum]
MLQGSLFLYDKGKKLAAFESNVEQPNCCILVGGLTDGLLSLPYAEQLSETLNGIRWSLVQPVLSSSYKGYGISSLAQDCEELDALIEFCIQQRNKKKVVIIGHSTGCQDAIWFMRNGKQRAHVAGIVLQAAASDVEYANWTDPELLKKRLAIAAGLIADGRPDELMPREVESAPISAYRFHSLYSWNGDDDMFTSTMDNSRRQEIFQDVKCPILFFLSGKDEYVPKHLTAEKMGKLFLDARGDQGQTDTLVVDAEGNHALAPSSSQKHFCDVVRKFIQNL